MKTISLADLQSRPLKLLDVRLKSEFDRAHLPDALNNCVFEVAFLDRMAELAPDKNEPICVYGCDESSHESRMAAEKLHRAGYANVHDFRGGVAEWERSGNAVSRSAEAEPGNESSPETVEGERPINTAESAIEWTGRNLGNRHWGTLKFKSGTIALQDGVLTGGRLVIDMHSITDLNLEDGQMRRILEEHLKSDDFFDVERFPEAVVELTSVTAVPEASLGMPNFKIQASMTMKDATDTVEFDASAHLNMEGQWVAQANFDFDRTKWNVIYGSGRFFRNLGMHVVNDLISLQLKIVA